MSQETSQTENMPHCIVDDRWFDTTVVISCSGELDMLTAPILERHIAATLKKKPTAVIIDLTEVAFLASCGMGVIVAAHDDVTADIAFSVVADGPVTSRPMRLIGIDKVVTMHATLDAALDHLGTANSQPRENN
jgi:anti-sigma B factor antagonist